MKYILSIGMNDYKRRLGGTNKVILEHFQLFREHGYGYIYICPVRNKNGKLWEIIVNNYLYRIRKTEHLLFFLYNLELKGNSILEIHIHHLLNVSLVEIGKILSYVNGNIKYYIHDYFSICPSIKLLKNDKKFCGAEGMSERKCKECKYYLAGVEQNILLRKIFAKYEDRITFIAPSDIAKEVWLKAYPAYREKTIVIYHQKLWGAYPKNRELVKDEMKVAFLGEQSYAKGWNAWKEITSVLSEKQYQFFYFGKDKDENENTINVNVNFQKNLNAMIYALRKKKIDCVILWSKCEETYSYTYYESLAANVYVITSQKSGNIAKQVAVKKNGIVLKDEDELIALLENFNLLKKYVNSYKLNGSLGPAKLIINSDILKYINADADKNVKKIRKNKITWEERFFSFYYAAICGMYCLKRIMP